MDNLPTVKDVMTREVISFTPETSVRDAMRRLVTGRVGGAPVIDGDEKVIGVLSESDIVRLLKRQSEASRKLEHAKKAGSDEPIVRQMLEFLTMDWLWYLWDARSIRKIFEDLNESEVLENTNVTDIMTTKVKTVAPEDDMEKAVELMNSCDVNRLPVVDADNHLLGIVARGDILRGLVE